MILFFIAGFIAAILFLIIASVYKDSPNAVRSLAFLAFLCLISQGGCLTVASGFGRATGGGGSIDDVLVIIAVAFLIACVWSFALGERPVKTAAQSRWQTGKAHSARSIPMWIESGLVLVISATVLCLLTLWPTARRDMNSRKWFFISEFGLMVILYAVSCRLLCRNRFLALGGMLAASFTFIYYLWLLDS